MNFTHSFHICICHLITIIRILRAKFQQVGLEICTPVKQSIPRPLEKPLPTLHLLPQVFRFRTQVARSTSYYGRAVAIRIP